MIGNIIATLVVSKWEKVHRIPDSSIQSAYALDWNWGLRRQRHRTVSPPETKSWIYVPVGQLCLAFG